MGLSKDEGSGSPALHVSREPVGPRSAAKKDTNGDRAVRDALIIVGIAWAVLFFLAFSLRSHNI